MDKDLTVDIDPYRINGVYHIGTSSGETARYYHRKGVYTVLWFGHKQSYKEIYSHTCQVALVQSIYEDGFNSTDKKFIDFWRRNAADINPFDFDMVYLNCPNPTDVLKGFDFAMNSIRVVALNKLAVSIAEENQLNNYLAVQGYRIDQFTEEETFFRKG